MLLSQPHCLFAQVHSSGGTAIIAPATTSAPAIETTGTLKTLASAVPMPPPPFLPTLPIPPPPIGEYRIAHFTELPNYSFFTQLVCVPLAVVPSTSEALPTDLPISVSMASIAEGGGTPPPDDHTPEKGDVWKPSQESSMPLCPCTESLSSGVLTVH